MSNDFKKYLNVYTFKCVLPGTDKEIEFKPIITGDLKKLLIYENDDNPEKVEMALDKLIESCVVTEDFDIDDLYLQDRYFLLFEIRKRTKGETYKFEFKCPKCNSQNVQIIDLNDLNVVRLKDKKIQSIVKLTDDISVRMSHIIRGAQKEVYESIKNIKNESQYKVDLAMTTSACGVIGIITPDGEDNNINLNDKKFLIENISTSLYEKIINWYSDNNFGIDFKYSVKCRNCGYEEKSIEVPVNNFFL